MENSTYLGLYVVHNYVYYVKNLIRLRLDIVRTTFTIQILTKNGI